MTTKFFTPQGPQYIDTASCQCALEVVDQPVWRCIGNLQTDVYASTNNDGKWFFPSNDTTSQEDVTAEMISAEDMTGGPEPDTSQAYILDDRTDGTFEPLTTDNQNKLSLQDQSCTGQNSTNQTTIFYEQIRKVQGGGVPDGMCLQEGVFPLPIVNSTQWAQDGCLEGFWCPNNTIVRLPQYCTPVASCFAARLTGGYCSNPSQGWLEPQVCQAGYYCPAPGVEKLKCPAGHYCMVGTRVPKKCDILSICPAGSVQNLTCWPLVLLALVDILCLFLVFGGKLINRVRDQHRKPLNLAEEGAAMLKRGGTRAKNTIRGRNTRYQQLEDDFEMGHQDIPLRSIKPLRRSHTGFDAVLKQPGFRYSHMFTKQVSDEERDLQLFVQSLSKCLGANKFGLSFDFEDLSFTPKKSPKPVLSGVTGGINSGSLWGVMGASGAGKSTFVNVLMGKQTHTGGITRVNGQATRIKKYKKIIGYVPQDDIVLPELTVRENILHSARIRLPCTWPDKDIQRHVDILISCLQLSHVTDSLVGSTAKPVISGGQRKRVSIGMELAAAPMALFLDEPTSGLDATSASAIMTTLKAISRLGITVVTIIHQPRREIWDSLDSLILLGKGKMIYQGRQDQVKPYFENQGFDFPTLDNPADVVGDIIAGQGHHYKEQGDASVDSTIVAWENHSRFPRSPSLAPSSIHTTLPEEHAALSSSLKKRGAYWYTQMYYCFVRALLQQYRLKSSFFSELIVGLLAGSLLGLAQVGQKGANFRGFFKLPFSPLSSSIDYASALQMSLLVGIALGLIGSAPGVKIFGEEKLLYRREAEAGHNRFAYYMGKVGSTFPRIVLANLHFTVLFMFLATPVITFADAFLANLLYFWCIYGLASCVSMITRREDGPLIATISSLVVGIFSGASPSLHTVTKWHMLWFWRLMPGTWLSEAYFTRLTEPWGHLFDLTSASLGTGYVLNQYGLDVGVMAAIGFVYRFLAFLLMRLFNG